MNPDLRDDIYELHTQMCGGLADPNWILILDALADILNSCLVRSLPQGRG